MPEDLAYLVKALSPGALEIFKRQLASLPELERQRTFARLAGIPELADILGQPTAPSAQPQAEPQAGGPGLGQILASPEVPLWQKALGVFAAPFQWIHKEIIVPFASAVTAPWSPPIEGGEEMGFFERERAEYEQWEAPWGVKGVVETIPWFLLPGIGAVAGKGGMAAGRGVAGMLGRMGPTGRVAGKALEYSPWGLTEKAVGAVAQPIIGAAARPIVKKILPSRAWKKLAVPERVALAQEAGLGGKVGSKAWVDLSSTEKNALSKRLLRPTEEVSPVAPAGAERPPPIEPPIVSAAVPGGFDEAQGAAIAKLTQLVKETKPVTRETLALRRPEQSARIGEYERLLQQHRATGMSTEEADKLAIQALAGKYPEAEMTELLNVIRKGMTEDEVRVLFDIVADAQYASGFTRRNTIQALQDLLLTNRLQQNQIRLLEETFGQKLARELMRKRPFGVKARTFALDIANAPRALLASCDISGLLRQGGILVARHPIEGIHSVRPMLAALFSDKNATMIESIIRSRAGMDELVDATLRVPLFQAPLPTRVAAFLTEREEAFISGITNKIPFVKFSNRAYVTGLNDLRSRSALNVLNTWKKAGIRYTKDDVSDLNQLVNWASGRGTLPGSLKNQGPLLSSFLFSPRLIMSRLEFPTAILPWVTKSTLARREAWRTLLTAIGAGAGILTMAKMSGASDIELDPRSADFGKIKVGEIRLDVWTGYLQYIRFITQLSTAQRKTVGGRIMTLNRREVIDRFVKSKLSPAVGLVNDLLEGESYLGEDMPPKSAKGALGQLYQRMMPMAVQDLIDGVMQEGPLGGIVSSIGLLGVGVITYTDETRRARDKAAQQEYGMSWEEVGRQYGRAAQLRLEQTTPAILEAEQEQERRFATGTPTLMQQWQNEGTAIEETYRELVTIAAEEFRKTGDGYTFRDKVSQAATTRRTMYASRAKRSEYQEIVSYYSQPLDPERIADMNPGDVLRREYYQQLFGLDMYDEFGNYLFDEAERRELAFLVQHGQQALDYIEEYKGSIWIDKPAELKLLEQARDILRPYWQITDSIWSMYPPELKALSDQIRIMEQTDPARARQMLRRYPQILRARELIARYKKQMRDRDPLVKRAYQMFY